MKITMAEVPLTPGKNGELVLSIRAPGVVRSSAINLRPRLLTTQGGPEFDEELTLYVECDPGAPLRSRKFLVLAFGQAFTPKDGVRCEWVTSAMSAHSGMLHVFELIHSDA